MKHLLRIEVEPLPEQRWTEIERSLATRLEYELEPRRLPSERPRRSTKGRTLLIAALAMAAVVAVVMVLPFSPPSTALEHPSRIATGPNPTRVALPGLVLDVEPESAVVVGAETPQGQLVVIDRGSIVCRVAPRSSSSPLIVQAGELLVRVVGTRFSVTRFGEVARVKVFEGVVEITSRGQSRRVRAGETWPPEVLERPTSKFGSVVVGGSSVAPPPLSSSAPRQSTRTSPADVRGDAVGVRRSEPSLSTVQKSSQAASSTKAPVALAEAAPRRSPQAMFEEATALERSDPARASRLYGEVETGSDSWAQNALYARGRLEASRGNTGEARRLLEQYLQRFPRGSNAEDARAVLRRLR